MAKKLPWISRVENNKHLLPRNFQELGIQQWLGWGALAQGSPEMSVLLLRVQSSEHLAVVDHRLLAAPSPGL
jgi:hypothetical protein